MSTWTCICGTSGEAPDHNAAGKARTDHWVKDCPKARELAARNARNTCSESEDSNG